MASCRAKSEDYGQACHGSAVYPCAAARGVGRIGADRTRDADGSSENITDNANVFGFGSGQIITSQRFVETFLVNTSVNPNGLGTGVSSNSIFDANPPFAVAGALTINGRTFATLGSNYSGLYTSGDYQILSNDAVGRTRDDNNFYLDLTGTGLPSTISQQISLRLSAGQVGNDSFIDASSGGTYADAIGTLDPTTFSVPLFRSPPPGRC